MSENIRFSSDKYASIARQLNEILNSLSEAQSKLASIDLTRAEGSDIPVTLPALRLVHGNRVSAKTPEGQLDVLSSALSDENSFVRSVISAVNAAGELLSGAETSILNMLTGKEDSGSENSNSEDLLADRMDAVKRLLTMLQLDHEAFEGFVNRKKLQKIINAGYLYSGLSGNINSYFTDPSHEMAMNIIESLGLGKFPDTLSNVYEDSFDNLDKTVDSVGDITTIILDKESAEMLDDLIRSLPFSEDEMSTLSMLDINCIDDLERANVSVKLLNVVKSTMSDYFAMRTANQEKLDSICSGMLASGDSGMIETAKYLQSMKDPATCFKIAVAANTKELVLEGGADFANSALLDLYPDPTGVSKALISLSQTGTEALTNSSAIVDSANALARIDDARSTAYKAAVDAINDYMQNPSDAAYQKVIDTKNSYYTMTAETVEASKAMAEAQKDSALGIFNTTDTGKFDNLADICRSKVADAGVEYFS